MLKRRFEGKHGYESIKIMMVKLLVAAYGGKSAKETWRKVDGWNDERSQSLYP